MVYMFEAPIDMLSFITLNQKGWNQHSYVSPCGIAEYTLLQLLKDNPQIQNISLCLDHDEPGIKATERLKGILNELGYSNVSVLQSQYKDWNEDIKAQHGLAAIPAEELQIDVQSPCMKMMA